MIQKGALPTETTAIKLGKIKNELVPFETIQITSLLSAKKRKRKPNHQPENRAPEIRN